MNLSKSQINSYSFCFISLVISLIVFYLMYPFAKLPDSKVNAQPVAVEDYQQEINMGEDFGSLEVIDLMGYYLENPPAPKGSTTAKPKREFGGC